MESERTFPATTEGLASCQKYLGSLCDSPRPQIIMDEIVSNIVRCSGASAFSVRFERNGPEGVASMTFVDAGRPFDPTREAPEPDVESGIATRQIGGLGLFLVKKMSKSVAYRREDGRNVLTVVL